MNIVHVIGMGQDKSDLTASHMELIRNADLLVGGRRLLDMFCEHEKETLAIKADISAVVERIKSEMATKHIVVLASGDPLFYGIGARIARAIPVEHLCIHPNVTTVGRAFAAICQPWHDAEIFSLHSHTHAAFNFRALAGTNKAAFLTGPQKDPAYIARQLIEKKLEGFRVCVLEHLGHPEKEKITWFNDYRQVTTTVFSHPNMVILIRSVSDQAPSHGSSVSHETYAGMPDDMFCHTRGLITKSEIRAVSLSKLRLARKDHVVWDIGSGSGSVGIEAALQLPWGQVFAVEKNKSRLSDITCNIERFNLCNVKPVNLDFPEGHDALNTPDRIFIGGGGRDLHRIIDCCCTRIQAGGVIVINTVVLESMETASKALAEHGFSPEMIQVQVSRATPMPYGNRLNALNPVWIISGIKPTLSENLT